MTDTTDAPDVIRPPRTIVLAFAVTIVTTALAVASAALWWAYQNFLRHEFVRQNEKLKPTDKNRKKDYDLGAHIDKVNHDVHNFLTSQLIQSLLFGLALVLIAMHVRRGKSWARWLLLILLAVPLLPTATPYRFLTMPTNAPALTRVVGALVSITGLAVVVLLVVPKSSRYFAAMRGVTAGERASGAAPMGFRNLFGPRRPPPDDDTPAAKTTPVRRPSRAVETKPVAKPPAKPPATVRAKPPAKPPATVPDDKPPVRTPKAKVRAAGEPPSGESQPSPSRPASSVASKSRGKSRRGS